MKPAISGGFSAMPFVSRIPGAVAASLCAITLCATIHAQTSPVNGMRPADLRAHAIVDAQVVTAPGQRLEKATILIRDGVIEAIGVDLEVPPDARVWSGQGLTVYPGLIDPAILVKAQVDGDAAGAHWNHNVHPEVAMVEQRLPSSSLRQSLRKLGFTAAAVYPDAGVIRGSGVVIALGKDPEHVLAYQDRAGMAMAFDHGRRYGSGSYPGSLMGAMALIRQTIQDARWHQACRRIWSQHPEGNEPPVRADALVALEDVIDGRQSVLLEVDNEQDALRAAALAAELDLQLLLLGSGMEFRRLDEIQATGTPVIVPLKYPDRPKVEMLRAADRVTLREMQTWEQAPTNARRLQEANIPVAFTTHRLDKRGDFTGALHKAVQHGMSEQAALAALTTTPAQMLGLSHVMGTIEPGKAANLVVVDGSLFQSNPKIRETWINGRRYEITPTQRVELVGAGTLETDTGVSVPVQLDTSAARLLLTPSDQETIKARKVLVQKDQVSFVLEGSPFDVEGLVQLSGVIVADTVVGGGVLPDGRRFDFTIAIVPDEEAADAADPLTGAWTLEGPADSSDEMPDSMTLVLSDDGTVTGKLNVLGDEVEIESGTFDTLDGTLVLEFPGQDHSDVTIDAVLDETGMTGVLEVAGVPTRLTAQRVEPEAQVAQPPDRIEIPLGAYGRPTTPPAQTVLVRNATIWTCGPAGTLEQASMLVEDGKIVAVGRDLDVPPGAVTVIDARGKHVTPGLIDCHSHTGIDGGVNEWTQANTAEVRIGDCIDPDDVNWYRQLAGGLTAANQLHGSANPIGGQNSVVKLKWGGSADDFRMADAIGGIKFALGENVKRSENRYPDTRMGVETFIRDAFSAAQDYQAQWDRYQALPNDQQQRTYPPRRDLELDTLVEILNGERIVHCHSYRQDEILMLIRVADDFGFTIGTFQHVLEGYKVAEAMAAHGAGGSSFSDWWAYKVEVMDAIPHNGSLMTDVGVLVSFNSDSSELARRMNTEASKAVRYGGLEPAQALKLVTINPAAQLRIDDRTGSLEPGKDADFVIWSDDPLSTYARCEQTWIEGGCYFDLEQDLQMRRQVEDQRQRLIQKILAQSHGDRSKSNRVPAQGSRPGTQPIGVAAQMIQQHQAWMVEQIRLGHDPDEILPGECGCNSWWASSGKGGAH
jgi:N-acetylglucosamine-6-phosphate deacetylase